MKILNIPQGSPEWDAHRLVTNNASEAAVMMGMSPHATRNELLAAVKTTIVGEVSDYVQKRVFDPGHRFEALARPVAAKIIGEDLLPLVGTIEVSGLKRPLGASFDGLTMLYEDAFEHKRLNAELNEAFDNIERDGGTPEAVYLHLPIHHQIQMEQQCMVGGALRVIFMASDWSEDGHLIAERHCIYIPQPRLRAEILAGWKQFEADLETFEPPKPKVKLVAATMESLPALIINVKGEVLNSNIEPFRAHAVQVLESINRELTTDQHFADAAATVKWCGEVEAKLDLAQEATLGQMSTIEQIVGTVKELKAMTRRIRLELTNLVEKRKEEIKSEAVAGGIAAFKAHITALNQGLGGSLMPNITADFGGVIKGKRTVETLQNAVDTELARAKVVANETAERIRVNLDALAAVDAEYRGLFADRAQLVLKSAEDCQAQIDLRITKQKNDDAARAAAKKAADEAQAAADKAAADAKATAEAQAALKPAPTPVEPAYASAVVPPDAAAQTTTVSTGYATGRYAPAAQAPAPVERGEPTLALGTLNERFGITATSEFLEGLGFKEKKVGRSKLYHEEDYPDICRAMAQHFADLAVTREPAPF